MKFKIICATILFYVHLAVADPTHNVDRQKNWNLHKEISINKESDHPSGQRHDHHTHNHHLHISHVHDHGRGDSRESHLDIVINKEHSHNRGKDHKGHKNWSLHKEISLNKEKESSHSNEGKDRERHKNWNLHKEISLNKEASSSNGKDNNWQTEWNSHKDISINKKPSHSSGQDKNWQNKWDWHKDISISKEPSHTNGQDQNWQKEWNWHKDISINKEHSHSNGQDKNWQNEWNWHKDVSISKEPSHSSGKDSLDWKAYLEKLGQKKDSSQFPPHDQGNLKVDVSGTHNGEISHVNHNVHGGSPHQHSSQSGGKLEVDVSVGHNLGSVLHGAVKQGADLIEKVGSVNHGVIKGTLNLLGKIKDGIVSAGNAALNGAQSINKGVENWNQEVLEKIKNKSTALKGLDSHKQTHLEISLNKQSSKTSGSSPVSQKEGDVYVCVPCIHGNGGALNYGSSPNSPKNVYGGSQSGLKLGHSSTLNVHGPKGITNHGLSHEYSSQSSGKIEVDVSTGHNLGSLLHGAINKGANILEKLSSIKYGAINGALDKAGKAIEKLESTGNAILNGTKVINNRIDAAKHQALEKVKNESAALKGLDSHKQAHLEIELNKQSSKTSGSGSPHHSLSHGHTHQSGGKLKVDVSAEHNLGSSLHGAVNQGADLIDKVESAKHGAIEGGINLAGKVKGKLVSAGNTILKGGHDINIGIKASKQGALEKVKNESAALKGLDSHKQAHLEIELNKQSSKSSGSSPAVSQHKGNIHLDFSNSHGSGGSSHSGSPSSQANIHSEAQSGLKVGHNSSVNLLRPQGITNHGSSHKHSSQSSGKIEVDVSAGHNLGSLLHGAINKGANILEKVSSIKYGAINGALDKAGKAKDKLESTGNAILKGMHDLNIGIKASKQGALEKVKNESAALKGLDSHKQAHLEIELNKQSSKTSGSGSPHHSLSHGHTHQSGGKLKVDVSAEHNLGSSLHGAINQGADLIDKVESAKHGAIEGGINLAGKVKGKLVSVGNAILKGGHDINIGIKASKQGALEKVKNESAALKGLDSHKQAHLDIELNKQLSKSSSSGSNSQLGGHAHFDVSSSHGSEDALQSSSHVNVHGGAHSDLQFKTRPIFQLKPSPVIKISRPAGFKYNSVKDITAKLEGQNNIKQTNVHQLASQFEHKNEGSTNNVHHIVNQIELQNKVPSNTVKEISSKFEYKSKPHSDKVKGAVAQLETQQQHANSHKVGELAVKYEDKHHLGSSASGGSNDPSGLHGLNIAGSHTGNIHWHSSGHIDDIYNGASNSPSAQSTHQLQASGKGSSNINIGHSSSESHQIGNKDTWNNQKEVSGNSGSKKEFNVAVNAEKSKSGGLGGFFDSIRHLPSKIGTHIIKSLPILGLSVGGNVDIDKNSHKHDINSNSKTQLEHDHHVSHEHASSSLGHSSKNQHSSHSAISHEHSSSDKTSDVSSHKGGKFNLDFNLGKKPSIL